MGWLFSRSARGCLTMKKSFSDSEFTNRQSVFKPPLGGFGGKKAED